MTMTNAEWCIKNNIKFQEIHIPYDVKAKEAKIIYRNKEIGRSKFCDTSFTALKVWLDMEHVEPILDDAERRYLSAVIRPFRESVRSIEKSDIYRDEAICINTKKRYMIFPPFKAGTMYMSMELNRKYTLEELGL